jgi:hypothetical protein
LLDRTIIPPTHSLAGFVSLDLLSVSAAAIAFFFFLACSAGAKWMPCATDIRRPVAFPDFCQFFVLFGLGFH